MFRSSITNSRQSDTEASFDSDQRWGERGRGKLHLRNWVFAASLVDIVMSIPESSATFFCTYPPPIFPMSHVSHFTHLKKESNYRKHSLIDRSSVLTLSVYIFPSEDYHQIIPEGGCSTRGFDSLSGSGIIAFSVMGLNQRS